MAIKVKNNFVVEDIVDEKGNKLGELKFNPKDSRITSKMVEIFEELNAAMQKINNSKISKIDVDKLQETKDFENLSEKFKKICDAITTENNVADKVIKELSDIFGKETIDIFTGGTNDIESILPLIEAIKPYIEEARTAEISKYMPKKDNVME